MFITKVILCNLFAYYGEVSVEFVWQDSKNLYCIYGDNGCGKTSFIRCAKLLFLGTGLEDRRLPPIIERFHKNKLTPHHFIKGNSEWRGILNTNAYNEAKEEYYICFEGEIEGRDFSLKRSWENVFTPQIQENLYLKIGTKSYHNEEAQNKIDTIVPPNFVEFFFFDGEEIESISDNLRTKLREKIEEILQIKPLDIILKQIDSYKKELSTNESQNKELKHTLQQKRRDKEGLESDLAYNQEKLFGIEKDLQECQEEILQIHHNIQKLAMSASKEREDLISQKDSFDEKIATIKEESLKENLKAVVFVSNGALLQELEKEIESLQNSKQKGDIEALQRLMPEIREITHKETQNRLKTQSSNTIQRLTSFFDSILDSLPQKLESQSFANSYIPKNYLMPLRESLVRLQSYHLQKDIATIKESKQKVQKINEELDRLCDDDSTKAERESLEKALQEKQNQRQEKEKQKEGIRDTLKDIESKKEQIEKDIYNLEQNINTERIDHKLRLLESLKESIQGYKSRLIPKLREELRSLILENYLKLLPNGNIRDIEISKEFEITLKDSNNQNIIIANQSSGQKQILATAIIWALSKLSHSQIPFIMDTPLSRIDPTNRSKIIKEFYKQDSQVIVLPHGGEMGKHEYEFAKPNLAGLYKIHNTESSSYATIKKAMIEEIL